MKKMLKSKKGFSLIELLIVLAILAIIAAISINLFGGLIGNTKDRADKQMARTIKKSISTYIAASNDKQLFFDNASATSADDVDTILTELQRAITVSSAAVTAGAIEGTYGPYLENPNPAATPVPGSYAPQYNSANGGTNAAWDIKVHTVTGNVEVAATTAANYESTAD